MRKQIEFSKTIARPGVPSLQVMVLVVVIVTAMVVVVRGTCRYGGRFTSGGQVGTDRAEGAMARIREKDKGRRGREIRAPRAGA